MCFYIVAYGMFGVADKTVPMGTRLMILSGAYRLRYIAKRADVSRNCTQLNEWQKENASGKQVREFAIRRPTRRITQDTAFGGMRREFRCANICTLYAWQTSLPIFERQMRTQRHSSPGEIPRARRQNKKDPLKGCPFVLVSHSGAKSNF